jgi:hypothetical protein
VGDGVVLILNMSSFVFTHIAGCTFILNVSTRRLSLKATACQIEEGGERRAGPGVHNQIITLAQKRHFIKRH